MSDEQRGQIVAMMLAADADGCLPDDPQTLTKLCRLDSPPDLQAPEMKVFFEDVPEAYTNCKQIEHNPSPECVDNVVPLTRARHNAARHNAIDIDIDIDKDNAIAIEDPITENNIIPNHSSPALAGQKEIDSESESPSIGISKTPLAEKNQDALFLEAYNAVAAEVGLPRAARMSSNRKSRLRQRLKEHGPQGLAKALDNVRQSPFCCGDNARGWRADIDFILQSQSCQKLIEGRYASCTPKSNLQKAMELIDESNDRRKSGGNRTAAYPVLPGPGEVRPPNPGDIDDAVSHPVDWPE